MIGSVTPPGVAACAAAASQIRLHDSIDAPYTVIVAIAPFRRKSRREMPAVAPSSTARGMGTRCPWRRSIAARWVVCQSLQPQAVIDAPRWGSGQESVGAGQDERPQHALALDALMRAEHVLAPGDEVMRVEERLRVAPRASSARRSRPTDATSAEMARETAADADSCPGSPTVSRIR